MQQHPKNTSVFVSSTSEDLKHHRAVARHVILDLDWQPKMMEHFGTSPRHTVDKCRAVLEQCDLILLITAWRRGWTPTHEQGGNGADSITAIELEYAREHKIPVLALMASETWPGNLWEDDAEARAWVKAFRTNLNLPAVFFDYEPLTSPDAERLPAFRAKVKEALLQQKERLLEREASVPIPGRLVVSEPDDEPSPIYGREPDICTILDKLSSYSIAVTGLSGMGKSKVCSAVYQRAAMLADFPCRTFHWERLDYDAPPSFQEFVRRVVRAITGDDVDVQDPETENQLLTLTRVLRTTRCLLVVDQFESVIDRGTRKAGEEGFGRLLESARKGLGPARLMVTSWEIPRDARGVQMDHHVVRGLSEEAGLELLRATMEKRSKQVEQGFSQPNLLRVSRAMQGHPESLLVLASNYSSELLKEAATSREFTHATLERRASYLMERIHRRLVESPELAQTLLAVCTFMLPTPLAGVQRVSGLHRLAAIEALNELLNRSLVVTRKRRGEVAYDAHALVRTCVAEQSSNADARTAHSRAAKYYLELAGHDGREPRDREAVWLRLQVAKHLVEAADPLAAAELMLGGGLHEDLARLGYLYEILQIYERLAALELSPAVRSLVLGNQGLVYRDLGDYAGAIELYDKALELARDTDRRAECTQLVNLGDAYFYIASYDKALEFLERARAHAVEDSEPALEARALGCLGNVQSAVGDNETAGQSYRKAAKLCAKLGDKRYQGIWIGDLANLLQKEGKKEECKPLYRKAIRLAQEAGDSKHESWWRGLLGKHFLQIGDRDEALSCLKAAFVISASILDRRCIESQLPALLSTVGSKEELEAVFDLVREMMRKVHENPDALTVVDWPLHLLELVPWFAAEALERTSDPEGALQAYSGLLELVPTSASAYGLRARQYRFLAYESPEPEALLEKALNDYRRAVELAPDHDEYYMLRAATQAQRGQLERAIEDYDEASRANPANSQALLGKAEAEICLLRLADAEDTFARLNPRILSENTRAVSDALRGVCQALSGRSPGDLREALEANDVTLSVRSDWSLIEIRRLLKELRERSFDAERLQRAEGVWQIFEQKFREDSTPTP